MFSLNNTIDSNIIRDLRYGIAISTASGNVISNNIISNIHYEDGILIYRSNENHIANNRISAVSRGITLSNHSTQNTIEGNVVSNATQMALSVHFSSNQNLIINNQADQSKIGIILRKSSNNQIYNNNFKKNIQHASDDSNNTWNNEGIGNFWSGWISTEPYTISSTATDEFPQAAEFLVRTSIISEPNTASFRGTPSQQIVEDEFILSNQIFLLDKSFIIKSGGKLLIDNAFVESIGNFSEPIKIRVEAGGVLEIRNSTLAAEESGSSSIWIDPVEGASVTITDSHLHHIDAGLNGPGPSGPSIFVPSGSIIENNLIEDADMGISLLLNAQNTSIKNNTFRSILRQAIFFLTDEDKHNEITNNNVEDTAIYEIINDGGGGGGGGCFIATLRY